MELEINNIQKNINNKISDDFSKELKNSIEKNITSFSIDRFEGDFAVCENRQTGEFINIPKNQLPIEAKEGDILKLIDTNYVLDLEETQKEQDEIKNLVKNLFKRK